MLTSLSCLPFDLEYGDLAIAYHSVNTYTITWFEVGQILAETIDELYIVTVHVL